jgi:hypothetical protein
MSKLSESHLLSHQSIYILMIVAFVRLYARELGKFVLKPVYEDFKMKYMRTPIFFFQSNEASVLEHIAPTYFSIYSVELESHDRNVCPTLLC